MLALRATIPSVTGTARRGILNCVMSIQPSPMRQVYTVRVRQQNGGRPRVTVIDPTLTLYPGATALPHVYPNDELCLYYPGQWKPDTLLATTMVLRTAEWLTHYELWLVTGQWVGGPHHR